MFHILENINHCLFAKVTEIRINSQLCENRQDFMY
jgi:hypothetical protein